MFQIKICGITNADDALLAAELSADAIGLNFYEKSSRFITPEQTREIDRTLDIAIERVGVFVNASRDSILTCCGRATACNVQLHGDETPEFAVGMRDELEMLSRIPATAQPWIIRLLQTLGGNKPPREPTFRLIRAFRCANDGLDGINAYLMQCQKLGGLPHAVLLDACAPGSYGGTGHRLDWNMVREQRDKLLDLPLILAGGLTPDNVAEAIRTARPDAVDVASGVESSPGKKDPAKMRDFIANAKAAFATLARHASEG